MGLQRHSFNEKRVDQRVPVFHRARALGPEGQPVSLVIVDLSASGLMARCDAILVPGARLRVTLPAIGIYPAQIRWSLGGRIGCEFESPIGLENYYKLLTELTKIN